MEPGPVVIVPARKMTTTITMTKTAKLRYSRRKNAIAPS